MPQKKIRLMTCRYNIIGTSASNTKRIRRQAIGMP
jgi:hypothetical protein